MARRRTVTPPRADDDSPILPERLVVKTTTGAEYRAQWQEKRAWLRAHGIDPGDWSQVYPVLKATWAAYGMDSASDRARKRLLLTDSDRKS